MSTKTNKRYLKKEIRRICGAIAGECIMASLTIPGIDRKALEQIVVSVAETQEKTLRLISVRFPQTEKAFGNRGEYAAARRAYCKASFTKLKADFNKRIAEILGEMNALLPEEAREANKRAAAEK